MDANSNKGNHLTYVKLVWYSQPGQLRFVLFHLDTSKPTVFSAAFCQHQVLLYCIQALTICTQYFYLVGSRWRLKNRLAIKVSLWHRLTPVLVFCFATAPEDISGTWLWHLKIIYKNNSFFVPESTRNSLFPMIRQWKKRRELLLSLFFCSLQNASLAPTVTSILHNVMILLHQHRT